MTRCLECLSCGLQRLVAAEPGECPRCGYVGWAPVEALSEELRRALRDVPVRERRPPHLPAAVLRFRVRA